MRALATLVSIVVLVLAVGGSMADASVKRPAPLTVATGTVARLDLARITVGKTSCTLGTKGDALSGGFAVGEHVTIGCSDGLLRTLKLAPITTGPTHGVLSTVGRITVLPPPATPEGTLAPGTTIGVGSGGSICTCGTQTSFTFTTTTTSTGISVTGTQTVNGVTTTWVSTNASGTVSSFGPADSTTCPSNPLFSKGCDTITVDYLTCALDPFFYNILASKYAVGDTAGIACQDGVLRAISKP